MYLPPDESTFTACILPASDAPARDPGDGFPVDLVMVGLEAYVNLFFREKVPSVEAMERAWMTMSNVRALRLGRPVTDKHRVEDPA